MPSDTSINHVKDSIRNYQQAPETGDSSCQVPNPVAPRCLPLSGKGVRCKLVNIDKLCTQHCSGFVGTRLLRQNLVVRRAETS